MRVRKAFTIIPKLVGDAVEVSQLIANPPELVFNAALETIDAAGSVISAITERQNTALLEKAAKQNIMYRAQEYAKKLEINRRELESRLRREKKRLQDVRSRDEAAMSFANMVAEELKRVSGYLKALINDLKVDEEDNQWELDQLSEMFRRTARDYNRITEIINQGG